MDAERARLMKLQVTSRRSLVGGAISAVALTWLLIVVARPIATQGSSTCATTPGLISQNDADAAAINIALSNGFKYNNGNPLIASRVLAEAYVVEGIKQIGFGDAATPTECIWYITLTGVVSKQSVASRADSYSGDFVKMEIGLHANNGDALSEKFFSADFTPEPTRTPGSTPTSYYPTAMPAITPSS